MKGAFIGTLSSGRRLPVTITVSIRPGFVDESKAVCAPAVDAMTSAITDPEIKKTDRFIENPRRKARIYDVGKPGDG